MSFLPGRSRSEIDVDKLKFFETLTRVRNLIVHSHEIDSALRSRLLEEVERAREVERISRLERADYREWTQLLGRELEVVERSGLTEESSRRLDDLLSSIQ